MPAMAVLDLSRYEDDPHLASGRVGGGRRAPDGGGLPPRAGAGGVDAPRPACVRHAPRPGEHTREVLAEAGSGPAEIDELVSSGAAGVAPEGPDAGPARPGEGNAP